jgi:hypothetical protein
MHKFTTRYIIFTWDCPYYCVSTLIQGVDIFGYATTIMD